LFRLQSKCASIIPDYCRTSKSQHFTAVSDTQAKYTDKWHSGYLHRENALNENQMLPIKLFCDGLLLKQT